MAVRLMLSKEHPETNAGKDCIVSQSQTEAYLESKYHKAVMKTIYSNSLFLDELFGLHLEHDEYKKGFYLLNPPFELYELQPTMDGV